jgi:hypothetical protein
VLKSNHVKTTFNSTATRQGVPQNASEQLADSMVATSSRFCSQLFQISPTAWVRNNPGTVRASWLPADKAGKLGLNLDHAWLSIRLQDFGDKKDDE